MSRWSSNSQARRNRRKATWWKEWTCSECATTNWMERPACRTCEASRAPARKGWAGAASEVSDTHSLPATEVDSLRAALSALPEADHTQALRTAMQARLDALTPTPPPMSAGSRLDQANARLRKATVRRDKAQRHVETVTQELHMATEEVRQAQQQLQDVQAEVAERAAAAAPLPSQGDVAAAISDLTSTLASITGLCDDGKRRKTEETIEDGQSSRVGIGCHAPPPHPPRIEGDVVRLKGQLEQLLCMLPSLMGASLSLANDMDCREDPLGR